MRFQGIMRRYGVHLVLIVLEIALGWWIFSQHLHFHGYIWAEKDKSPWTLFGPYAAPLAGLIGGVIALTTYNRGHRQKDVQFERAALDARFADILNRLSGTDPILRANAAIRLAEMAEQQQPGSVTNNLGGYPFFPRAASQLAAAVHMEKDDNVRAEVVKALERMTVFARHRDDLSNQMLKELADANRNAKTAFVGAMAAHYSVHVNPDKEIDVQSWLDLMCDIAPICGITDSQMTQECVLDLVHTSEFRASGAIHSKLMAQKSEVERKSENSLLLAEVYSSWRILHSTIKALERVIRALPEPANIPVAIAGLDSWKRSNPPNLGHCILAGANITGAHLEGACLIGLFGHNLCLYEAHLQGASIDHSKLQGANFSGADLRGSNMGFTDYRFATFVRSDLRRARLYDAILIGCRFPDSKMEGTMLKGATVENEDGSWPADFQQADWAKASFADDTKLRQWMNLRFYRPLAVGATVATDAGPSTEKIETNSLLASQVGEEAVIDQNANSG